MLFNALGWNGVPVGDWVHVSFVRDLGGIGATQDTMRIYRDGEVVPSSAASVPGIQDSDAPVKLLGHHAYSRFGHPTLRMDEIRVRSLARTSFPWPKPRGRRSPWDRVVRARVRSGFG